MRKAKRKLTLAAVLLASVGAAGDATLHTVYEAEVVRIIDSDTQVAKVSLFPGLTQEVSIRTLGIDTPENLDLTPNARNLRRTLHLRQRRMWQN